MTVYPPREDSYLLKEYLEELDLEGKKCLDMGTGSGILAVTMAKKGAEVTAVDINPEAVEKAGERAEKAGVKLELVESDLFEAVKEENFDLVVFNPPYLPGEEGIGDEEIWKGGERGVEETERFLESVDKYLSGNGHALAILSSHADIDDLIDRYGLEIVEEEKVWFENLFLARYK